MGERQPLGRPESGYTHLPVHTHRHRSLRPYIYTSKFVYSQAWIPSTLADSHCGLPSLASPGCHTSKRTEGPGCRLAELSTEPCPLHRDLGL